jgi:membrane protease YdiL (CAAX protease family)
VSLAVGLSLIAVAYNNVVNRWKPFHGTAYVPINLVFVGAVTTFLVILDFSSGALGLHGDWADVGVALAVVAPFAALMFAIARSRHGHRITDERVQGLRGSALAFYVLVRIPIGTAVTEELLFRGVLFAVWREAGASAPTAALCASVAFGLWHIQPTIIGLRMNDPGASRRKVAIAVVGAVLLTTIAGLALTWLRVETAGLVAPMGIHAGINSVSALAAVAAGRRFRPPQ